jgi:hypothetical protein
MVGIKLLEPSSFASSYSLYITVPKPKMLWLLVAVQGKKSLAAV